MPHETALKPWQSNSAVAVREPRQTESPGTRHSPRLGLARKSFGEDNSEPALGSWAQKRKEGCVSDVENVTCVNVLKEVGWSAVGEVVDGTGRRKRLPEQEDSAGKREES